MCKKISILGSTGSIGKQTLEVARNNNYRVLGISANSNIELLEAQAREFNPKMVCVYDEKFKNDLEIKLKDKNIKVVSGIKGLIEIATIDEVETVVTSVVGSIGLKPTIYAIRAKKDIALANKETLVAAGQLVMREAKENGVNILPVDSEHSAIFQSLMGNNIKDISKIILTASGGPFRGKTKEELKDVCLEDALNHPNWSMGSKITIDSATLMNKGLEVIEAKWLFDVDVSKIQVLVHPQSIIHSMVEYIDGSVIAQMGSPDMRVPIQFALTYPYREKSEFPRVNFLKNNNLTFEEPDMNTFRCLHLAFEAIKIGGTMPVVLNAANEVAVGLFLQNKISFLDIEKIIEEEMKKHINLIAPTLDDILVTDFNVKKDVMEKYLHLIGQ